MFPLSLIPQPEKVLASAASLVESAMEQASRVGLKCFGVCVAWAGLVRRDAGELAYGPTSGWRDVGAKGGVGGSV